MKTLTFTILSIISLVYLRNSYDVLHAHLAFSPAVAAAIAGKLLRKSVIVKFGSNNTTTGEIKISQKTWRGRLRLAILKKWVDVCIALDSEMEEEILSAGFTRDQVVRMVNGIDAQKFKPDVDKELAREVLKLGLHGKVLAIYTGRLVTGKGLDLLLMAMKQALPFSPELHLLLIGRGEEKESLVSLVKELNIQHCVTFIDYVSDVQPYLTSCDVFVLPSLGEGISNSLLEAMSCGMACIATSVGGSTEVLGHGECGVLIAPNCVDELSEALISLSNSPAKRAEMGRSARRRILETYDFQVVGKKYFELYQQLLDDR